MNLIRKSAFVLATAVTATALTSATVSEPASAATMSCYSQLTAANQAHWTFDGWLQSYNTFKDNVVWGATDSYVYGIVIDWYDATHRMYTDWKGWDYEYLAQADYIQSQLDAAYEAQVQANYDYGVCAAGG